MRRFHIRFQYLNIQLKNTPNVWFQYSKNTTELGPDKSHDSYLLRGPSLDNHCRKNCSSCHTESRRAPIPFWEVIGGQHNVKAHTGPIPSPFCPEPEIVTRAVGAVCGLRWRDTHTHTHVGRRGKHHTVTEVAPRSLSHVPPTSQWATIPFLQETQDLHPRSWQSKAFRAELSTVIPNVGARG